MAERIQNPDGSVTWRYASWDAFIEETHEALQKPSIVDADLELKDRRDSWRD